MHDNFCQVDVKLIAVTKLFLSVVTRGQGLVQQVNWWAKWPTSAWKWSTSHGNLAHQLDNT